MAFYPTTFSNYPSPSVTAANSSLTGLADFCQNKWEANVSGPNYDHSYENECYTKLSNSHLGDLGLGAKYGVLEDGNNASITAQPLVTLQPGMLGDDNNANMTAQPFNISDTSNFDLWLATSLLGDDNNASMTAQPFNISDTSNFDLWLTTGLLGDDNNASMTAQPFNISDTSNLDLWLATSLLGDDNNASMTAQTYNISDTLQSEGFSSDLGNNSETIGSELFKNDLRDLAALESDMLGDWECVNGKWQKPED